MRKANYYGEIIERLGKSSVQGTLSILGVHNEKLRKHLFEEMGGGKLGSKFLADPVYEATFPWKAGGIKMGELAGNMLNASLISAMDLSKKNKFAKHFYPYTHQLTAWNILTDASSNQSVVVTSGTGSGKTECFMVPILNDMANQLDQKKQRLEGVQALFLYPLNALINSQRERLSEWTSPFKGNIRFCLYNGNTEENKHKDEKFLSSEVLTRKKLRESPPPILVTNSTMLEYMLVRQNDAPILEKSKGKLKWIVLDEAHTYTGSQAAEMSLLIRRTLHEFGVTPDQVRFVATSATIGNEGADEQLKMYLAQMAGVSIDRITIIGGSRSVPVIDPSPTQKLDIEKVASIEPDESVSDLRFAALSDSVEARGLRNLLSGTEGPCSAQFLAHRVLGDTNKAGLATELIDLASSTFRRIGKGKEDIEPFIPVRGHLYHQVLNGIWCCSNSACTHKKETELEHGWPFGFVYIEQRVSCVCGSPVFELGFCRDCNEPHLLASIDDQYLEQAERESIDEFSLAIESDDEGNEDDNDGSSAADSEQAILSPVSNEKTYRIGLAENGEILSMGEGSHNVDLLADMSQGCSVCDYSSNKIIFLRRCLLGAPFYVSNSVPYLLEACEESSPAANFPNRGRKLITFTDSRQGTARIATKIQQDSERDALRGLVYQKVTDTIVELSESESSEIKKELEEKRQKVNKLEAFDDSTIEDIIEGFRAEISALEDQLTSKPSPKPVGWQEMIDALSKAPDVYKWMYDYYKAIAPETFSVKAGVRLLAELLLLREFSRRPKRANSLETLGLVRIEYPLLDSVTLPEKAKSLGFSEQDWKDFLKVTLDFHIRENSIINILDEHRAWIGAKIAPKTVFKPNDQEKGTSRIKHWPKVRGKRSNRMVRLICLAMEMDPLDKASEDVINSVMSEAFFALTKPYHVKNLKTGQNEYRRLLVNQLGERGYHLDKNEIFFSCAEKAWVCPITNRLLDTTFRNLSPYLPFVVSNINDVTCPETHIPFSPIKAAHGGSDFEKKKAAREWVESNKDIIQLRSKNLWTDLSDRIIEQGRFFRVAEHSAQQPQSKLQKYEALFKANKLNVLSCSTTMEMGVDIGGISVVAMNNVPPHPANYLQRAGRAGRRRESQALAFTICKDNPHERMVFKKPTWPFVTKIPAPYINLGSERIVQRHINAIMLSHFIKRVSDAGHSNATSLTVEWFFEPIETQRARCEDMIALLKSWELKGLDENVNRAISSLKVNTILAGDTNRVTIRKSVDLLEGLLESWTNKIQPLKSAFIAVQSEKESDPYRRKVEHDLAATLGTYLLADLANKTFLPTYGFPTGIASFDHYTIRDYIRNVHKSSSEKRIDNLARIKDRPGRSMPMAIREYSPGSQVILDGLVHKSSGIILKEFGTGKSSGTAVFSCAWRCEKCGTVSQEELAINFENRCKSCGSQVPRKHIKEFVEPEGFAVDFYSTPTVDVTSQSHIPVQSPWVTADSKLEKLFIPAIGSFRTSPMGHIFHHTSGEHGKGFAICLRCGRAESMSASGEFPADLQPGVEHKRLRGKPGAEATADCDGPASAYWIKPNMHLGKADTTDVFELYLKNPETGEYLKFEEKSSLLWTVAVALRQALANVHGINADEIGFAVSENTIDGVAYPVANISLFDNAGGGAGFSSTANIYIETMLKSALSILDCPSNCEGCCQDCLLSYDTRFHSHILVRQTASSFIRKIVESIDLYTPQCVLNSEEKLCARSLEHELMSLADQNTSSISILVSGDYDEWDIASSGLKDLALGLGHSYQKVSILICSDSFAGACEEDLEDLRALSHLGVEIQLSDDPTRINKAIITQVDNGSSVRTFASADVCVTPSANFQKYSGALVSSLSVKKVLSNPAVFKARTDEAEDSFREVELLMECNGRLNQFGQKFWNVIESQSPALAKLFGSDGLEVKYAHYSDPYISTPIAALLFNQLILELAKKLPSLKRCGVQLSTRDLSLLQRKRPCGIFSEWQDNGVFKAVLSGMFAENEIALTIVLKDLRNLPHGRCLTIGCSDGYEYSIRLDHGFGCWGPKESKPKWFDIGGEVDSQIKGLLTDYKSMSVTYKKKYPTQIFVKKAKL